jgi:hypothetical protein
MVEMDNQVCIVIPVYKAFAELDENELISWQQCLQILGSRPIYLACPVTLPTAGYLATATQQGITCQIVTFAPRFFAGIDGYNRLMLSRQFYQHFVHHTYLLLYQLDAFVFKDELSQWCNLGYSYVGAPWFKSYLPTADTPELWQVGNGGFTLRKVADCLRVLNTFAVARDWSVVVEEHSPTGSPSTFKRMYLLGKYLLLGNNTHWLFNDFHRYRMLHQEDYFWGVVCKETFPWYKVPTPQQALAFSFEVAPSIMYDLNYQRLPMGCHAWEKHEPLFWKPFIEQAVAL